MRVFFLIFGLFITCVHSQQNTSNDSLIIQRIILVGNEKTQDKVILRELESEAGKPLDFNVLQQDQKRLLNLNLFTRVDIQPVQTEAGVALIVFVAERWYIFPLPILFYTERDVEKLSYGFGIVHENFRGAATYVQASGWLGYNPGFELVYRNPWIGGGQHLFSQITLYSKNLKTLAILDERFEEKHRGLSLTLGKRWGHHLYASLTAGYRRVELPENDAGLAASPDGVDHLPSLGCAFRYDTRDLYAYPRKGIYFSVFANESLYRSTQILQLGQDTRYYLPLWSSVILGGRLATDLVRGDVPVYEMLYLGYSERIRGHFDSRYSGRNRVMSSLSLRFPILPVRYLNLDAGGLLPVYSNNLPFGISGALFADTGAVWQTWSALDRDDFLSGYGFGLHVHLPYIDLFRIDFAYDTKGHREMILDIGVWF